MRLGADSWLFFKVAEKDDAAMRLLREVEHDKHRLIVSVLIKGCEIFVTGDSDFNIAEKQNIIAVRKPEAIVG